MTGLELDDSQAGTVILRLNGKRRESWKDPVLASSRVMARVCGACGYTELVAANPDELYQAYRKIGN
jgi:hypothetical protein